MVKLSFVKVCLDHTFTLLPSPQNHIFFTVFTNFNHKKFRKHISILRSQQKVFELQMVLKPYLVSAMNAPSNTQNLTANNKQSLARLNRAITFSQGQFSAILVRCDDICLREKIVKYLGEKSSVKIKTLVLSPSINTLYTTLKTKLADKQPQALMVLGLESVFAIDEVLVSTNLIRDEFRKQFPFPLVLWVNEDIIQKLIRLAPDFKNWTANPIIFDVAKNHLVEWETISV